MSSEPQIWRGLLTPFWSLRNDFQVPTNSQSQGGSGPIYPVLFLLDPILLNPKGREALFAGRGGGPKSETRLARGVRSRQDQNGADGGRRAAGPSCFGSNCIQLLPFV